MPRQICPHYPDTNASAGGVSRCRACGVIIGASPAAEVATHGEYPGTPAAAGTGLAAMKAGNVKAIDSKAH